MTLQTVAFMPPTNRNGYLIVSSDRRQLNTDHNNVIQSIDDHVTKVIKVGSKTALIGSGFTKTKVDFTIESLFKDFLIVPNESYSETTKRVCDFLEKNLDDYINHSPENNYKFVLIGFNNDSIEPQVSIIDLNCNVINGILHPKSPLTLSVNILVAPEKDLELVLKDLILGTEPYEHDRICIQDILDAINSLKAENKIFSEETTFPPITNFHPHSIGDRITDSISITSKAFNIFAQRTYPGSITSVGGDTDTAIIDPQEGFIWHIKESKRVPSILTA